MRSVGSARVSWIRRSTFVVVLSLGFVAGVPDGDVPGMTIGSPWGKLRSWVHALTGELSAEAASAPVVPQQKTGSAAGAPRYVTASATHASGGECRELCVRRDRLSWSGLGHLR